MKMGKRMTALFLAVVMVLSMTPIEAKALTADHTCRLVDTGITLSFFPVHYIVYDYAGSRIDSTKSTKDGNYNAWKKMMDSDKAKVTKWYAGFYSQMERQFGIVNAKDMLKWANEQNGWADAGSKLRARLADKNYPKYYEFYGDPDHPKLNADHIVEYQNRLLELSSYSAKEKEELSLKINDYNIAYSEGLDAYRRLIKLKQAQTNVAVTAITSDLVQIIVDNLVVSSPLALPSSIDDLKDATINFVDQSLEISETLKKPIYINIQYTGSETVLPEKVKELIPRKRHRWLRYIGSCWRQGKIMRKPDI